MRNFSCFVGIDQTGAARDKGNSAAPLPAVVAREMFPGKWKFRARDARGKRLMLPSLTPAHLQDAIGNVPWHEVGILVDCVLGLPEQTWHPDATGAAPLWQLMSSTLHSGPLPPFGRNTAHTFFSRYHSGETYPLRTCERIARSNSVFQTRPFQRNIQTGTYRLWRDLASHGQWANVWPHDDVANAREEWPWIFEGYPSLCWKLVLQCDRRTPETLREHVEALADSLDFRVEGWNVLAAHPDSADAFVLALAGVLLQNDGRLFEPFPGFRKACPAGEGWLVGLSPTEAELNK